MKRGFSLVELSIVLVILGLLTGGILAGQSLIRAAELRDVSTQIQRFLVATQSFRDRYMAIPGDMRNATKFWGAANTGGSGGECASPTTNAGTGTQTCNGDGSGYVGNNSLFYERYRYWQHLASAGLIEGAYTGIYSGATQYYVSPGVNVPQLKIGGGTACMNVSEGNSVTDGTFPNGDNWQVLMLGININGTFPCSGPFLLPEEAWNIDTKLDDGKPGQGKIQTAMASKLPNCADSDNENTAQYVLTNRSKTCTVGVKLWQ